MGSSATFDFMNSRNEDNAREALFIVFSLDVSTVTGHLGPGLPAKFPRAAWAEIEIFHIVRAGVASHSETKLPSQPGARAYWHGAHQKECFLKPN